MNLELVSLFSGCGGLDIGFAQAGFSVAWANENDKSIWQSYALNHANTFLEKRSILDVQSSEIPNCIGIIGGPPCQSWSEAGAGRGIQDSRGQLFFEYIRVLKDKQPLFFLAENVSGILEPKHADAFKKILKAFSEAGYSVVFKLLNAEDYSVPQSRKRVIIIGYHKSMGKKYTFPSVHPAKLDLKHAIGDLPEPLPALPKNRANKDGALAVPNHEYMLGGFSTIYMSRNRVRAWDEQSFTIQAGGRHAPCHPQANKMPFVEKDKRMFDPDTPKPYRRLSVRECLRIQTFPDDFILQYNQVGDGYKMVGNAVPVHFAKALAEPIYKDIMDHLSCKSSQAKQVWIDASGNRDTRKRFTADKQVLV